MRVVQSGTGNRTPAGAFCVLVRDTGDGLWVRLSSIIKLSARNLAAQFSN
jgi:hypothetical protein